MIGALAAVQLCAKDDSENAEDNASNGDDGNEYDDDYSDHTDPLLQSLWPSDPNALQFTQV
jgi:hypothetical protein